MIRVRIVGLALFAVFAVSVVAASAAQAIEAPYFQKESSGGVVSRLKLNETRNFKSANVGSYILTSGLIVISCTSETTNNSGVLLGSEKGEPGTNNETVEFKGCSVTGNGSGACTGAKSVGEPIITKPLKTELVYGVETKKTYTLFSPASGAEFVKLTFPAGCTHTETAVSGKVAAENLNEAKVEIELGKQYVPQTKGFVSFPSTPIKKVVKVKAGVAQAPTTVELVVFGAASILTGESSVELESKEKWCILP
jgi:hypothetical protein